MTLAPLPEDLDDQFGPQLTALIAYLTVVRRLPRSVVQLQQINALVYLTAAIRAHRRRQVVASLLSKSATP